jgi:catechol 2,3-dioxygenase-like lactoylglutathione lyase family enzyme
MPLFHHVNLGVPPDDVDAEIDFLMQVLDFRPVPRDEAATAVGARWYQDDDGAQIHLSTDPDHRPAAMAHVAIEYGPALATVEDRLRQAGVPFDRAELPGFPPVLLCRDPAGNRWELRGENPPK